MLVALLEIDPGESHILVLILHQAIGDLSAHTIGRLRQQARDLQRHRIYRRGGELVSGESLRGEQRDRATAVTRRTGASSKSSADVLRCSAEAVDCSGSER